MASQFSELFNNIKSIDDYKQAREAFEQEKRLKNAQAMLYEQKALNPEMGGNLPANLQVFNKLLELDKAGESDKFNMLYSLARSAAYGVDSHGGMGNTPRPQASPNPVMPNPVDLSGERPDWYVAPEQGEQDDPAVLNDQLNSSTNQTPQPRLTIAEQIAQNAGLKKTAETNAVNQSDLGYKPQIAGSVESATRAAEIASLEDKANEEKRIEANAGADEAAPTLEYLLQLNKGTVESPYAAAFQPFLKVAGDKRATNLDLMKQARISFAIPLAKLLGTNPTDRDLEATLDGIFDINATQASREAQILAFAQKLKQKKALYNGNASGATRDLKNIDINFKLKQKGFSQEEINSYLKLKAGQ